MRRKRLQNGFGENTPLGSRAWRHIEKAVDEMLSHPMFKDVELPDIEHAVLFQVESWSTQKAADERGALNNAMLAKQKERVLKHKKPLGETQLKRAAANKVRWGL
jgi:hypothetical protein